MISDSVRQKMRAALLVCTCAGGAMSASGCVRGKHSAATGDASDVNDANVAIANDPGKQDGSAIVDASSSAPFDATTTPDDDDEPHDASIDAPYGVVACPIHGAHPKLPDGGVDMTGVQRPSDVGAIGLGNIGTHTHECLGCGMGGPISRPHTEPREIVTMGVISGTQSPAASRVFHAQIPRFRACYRAGLNADPSMTGRIQISVHFDAKGAVSTAPVIVQSGFSSGVVSCVTTVTRRIESADLANATVVAPFDFKTQGD